MFESIFNFFSGSKALKKATPKKRQRLGFESLEDRTTPATFASVTGATFPYIREVLPGASIKVVEQTAISNPGYRPTPVAFRAAYGNAGIPYIVQADVNGDAIPDVNIGSGVTGAPGVTRTFRIPAYVAAIGGQGKPVTFYVTAKIPANRPPGYIGFKPGPVGFVTAWGSALPQQYVQYGGVRTNSYVYVRPATHGMLGVTGVSLGSGITAVSNQVDVPLYSEEVRATGDTIRLYQQTFVAAQGSVNDFTRYNFGVDTNNDGKVGVPLAQNVVPVGGKVVFNTNYTIPNGGTANLLVTGNVAPSRSFSTFQLRPDTSSTGIKSEDTDDGRDQVGVKVNGVGTGEINLITVPGPVISFLSQGTVAVKQSLIPLLPDYLLAGTEGQRGLRAIFSAGAEEDVYLTKVHVLVDTVGARSLELIGVYQVTSSGLVLRAHATAAGLGSEIVPFQSGRVFAANIPYGQLLLPKGTDTELVFLPVAKSDVDGAISGDFITLQILSLPGYQPVSGIGASSSNQVGVSVGTGIASPAYYVSGSKVTGVTNANPDVNGSNVPLGVAPVGQFTLTTAPNSNFSNGPNKTVINELVFHVVGNNVAVDTASFRLLNKADPSAWISPSTVEPLTGGAWKVVFTNLSTSLVNTVIDQGTSQTLVLGMNVTNNKVNVTQASTLHVNLVTDLIKWFDRDALTNTLFVHGFYLSTPVVGSTTYQS